MNIRAAEAGDAGPIARVHVRAWQLAYRDILPARVLDALSVERRELAWSERIAANVAILVADRAGSVAGWISFGPNRDADARSGDGEVYGLYVDPDSWSQGIGTALWKGASRDLGARGYRVAKLWVLEANDRARRFYERRGFTPEPGMRKLYERDGATAPEIRYGKPLEPD
jgi:ribosomal protein S18 acetylase RimI-like enzyme